MKYRQYRNFWFGMLSAVGGFQVLQFGQFWLVFQLTGSPLFLGYVGLANAIPAITLNLAGGVVADRFNRRRLIMLTETTSASMVFLLAVLTLTDVVEVWHILTIAVFAGAVNAFNQPARQSLYPLLIDRSAIMSAVALNSAIWQGTRVVAPAVAGGIITLAGTAAAFFVAGTAMLVFTVVVASLSVEEPKSLVKTNAAGDLLEGLKFIKGNSIFSFLIGMTFFNSFFGMAYISQMPVFAVDILDVGASGQGALMSAGGIASLIVTFSIGIRSGFRRKGLVLIGGAVMTGLSLATFALTARFVGSYPLAIGLMFAIGGFTSMYMISIMSSLQVLVPDHMRGRVMGFYGMTWNIMPLGGLYAGALATLTGVPVAIAIGGFLVSSFALGPALLNRRVRNLGTIVDEALREASPRPAG